MAKVLELGDSVELDFTGVSGLQSLLYWPGLRAELSGGGVSSRLSQSYGP